MNELYEEIKAAYLAELNANPSLPNRISAMHLIVKEYKLGLAQAKELIEYFDENKGWEEVPPELLTGVAEKLNDAGLE